MKNVQENFNTIKEYLFSMESEPLNGWYSFKIGLPKKWVCSGNDLIDCVKLDESDEGVLYKLTPKDESIIIDDLIGFVNFVIEINNEIEEKERFYQEEKDRLSQLLNEKLGKTFTELTDLKKESFKAFNTTSRKKNNETKVLPVENKTIDDGKEETE